MKNNTLIASQDKNDLLICGKTLHCRNLQWLFDAPIAPFKAQARIRHGQKKQECWIYADHKNKTAKVDFIETQRCMTPGQAIVFYSLDHCLGGATICEQDSL